MAHHWAITFLLGINFNRAQLVIIHGTLITDISQGSLMLKIEIVSDVACPWCIIGFQGLQAALNELDQPCEIEWKPFELNPDMALEGQSYADYSSTKYHRTKEQAVANLENVRQRGLDAGYEFKFDDNTRVYNTFDAHRLLFWAKEFGLQTELKLALFDLNFKQGRNLSDHGALLETVEQVGLDRDAAKEVLVQSLYSDEVRAEIAWAHNEGFHSVPTFIFNGDHIIPGGQSKDSFKRFISQLYEMAETGEAT